ncbi:hypothetical protein [Ilumatobacter sp.]|uniref:hypothetical protein n=1 Tax=Ilumatobacter sp. TaxID=1967498 RepID=UPI003B5292BF
MEWESTRAMRPFWMHQIVEYIIGAVFISTGFGSATPAIPAALGAIVMVNAAIAIGPGGAFRLVHRKVHRVLDVVVIALIAIATFQPVVSIDGNTRILMGLLGFVLCFVWWNTDFATKPERTARRRGRARPDSEEVGRSAGRTAADGYLAAKRLKKAMIDDRRDDDGSRRSTSD